MGCTGKVLSIIDSSDGSVEVKEVQSGKSLSKFTKDDLSNQGITKDGVRFQTFLEEHGHFFLLFRGNGTEGGPTVFQGLYRQGSKFLSDSMPCDS
jgi:hypothetical protein